MEQGWSVGALAKVQTTWGEVIEGRVYSFDSALGLLYLRMPSIFETATNNNRTTIRTTTDFFPCTEDFSHRTKVRTHTNRQKSTGKITKCVHTTGSKTYLNEVDESSVRQREAEAIKKIEAKSRKIGKGVTAEAQKAFNAIENMCVAF